MKNKNNSTLIKNRWSYYSLLNGGNIADKGDIRAFLALLTWNYERQSKAKNLSVRHNHSIRKSVQKLKNFEDPQEFKTEFNKNMRLWWDEGGPIERTGQIKPKVEPPVKRIKKWKKNGYNFISLFSGAFGLDLGFMAMGFRPLLALDIDPFSQETLAKNLSEIPFIREDIEKITSKSLLEEAGCDIGQVDLITGGPPCQPFSTAGRRESLQDPRASPLTQFIRVIKETQPKYFVIEEVPGLLSARIKHVPIAERGKWKYSADEEPGSAFKTVLMMLRSTKYKFTYNLLNAADYGAPQVRQRLIIIGCRDSYAELPIATHSLNPEEKLSGEIQPWTTFWDAVCDIQNNSMEFNPLTPKLSEYLRLIPPGGYWKHLPDNLIKDAMGGAYTSGGGKMGFFRRLSWDTPTPTVVTSPSQKSSMLCHPEELRPMSVEEYKRVQGFPDDWTIPGNIGTKYRLIGNAVPVYLSYSIAKVITDTLEGKK